MPSEPVPFFVRDYSNIDLIEISSYLNSNLDTIYEFLDSDEIVDHFNLVVKDAYDRFVPTKEIRPKTNKSPWFTKNIESLINRRNQAYRIWNRSRTPASLASYRLLRRDTKHAICLAKNNFINSHLPSNINTRELWNRIRNLGINNKDKVPIPFGPNEINSNFASPNHASIDSNLNLNIAPSSITTQFSFRNVDPNEVYSAVMSIKSNAVGSDGIPVKFVKIILPCLLDHLVYVYNKILTTSRFPSAWKLAKVIPIPKVGFPRSCSDLRPISILPGLSKAFERLIKLQLNEYLDRFKLISEFQSGFRKHNSTETALLSVCDDVICMLDDKNVVLLALLDFSKAFDTINHEKLLIKLTNNYGFTAPASNLISSYLKHRSQYVFIDNERSSALDVTMGVPQGSILGPLLFTLFINDLPTVLKHSNCRMFADDVQIYIGGKSFNIVNTVGKLNDDLDCVVNWAEHNGLILNPSKSKGILFSLTNADRYRRIIPPIRLKGQPIEILSKVKNLGVIMDDCLNWEEHINYVCGRIYGGLRGLWGSVSYTNLNIRKKLIKSLLLPHFTYCSTVRGSLNETVYVKLRKAFYSCLRYIYQVSRRTPMTYYSRLFLGCTLKEFLQYRMCTTMHKLLNSGVPQNLFRKLHLGSSRRTNLIRIPRNRTSLKNKSFFVYGVSIFNYIPNEIKMLSFPKFKTECLNYFCCNNI